MYSINYLMEVFVLTFLFGVSIFTIINWLLTKIGKCNGNKIIDIVTFVFPLSLSRYRKDIKYGIGIRFNRIGGDVPFVL